MRLPASMRLGIRIYVGVVMALGAWVLAVQARAPVSPEDLAVWVVACLAGELLWFRAPRAEATITMALAVDLAAILTVGAPECLLAIAVSTFLANLYPQRRPWHKALFNVAQSLLAGTAALAVIAWFGPETGIGGGWGATWFWLRLLLAGGAFFAVNSGLVAVVVGMSGDEAPGRTWCVHFAYGYELAITGALIALAGLVALAYSAYGALALPGFFPLLAVLWWSARREGIRRDASASGGAPLPAATPPAGMDPPLRRAS
jgi:hypothetical protein